MDKLFAFFLIIFLSFSLNAYAEKQSLIISTDLAINLAGGWLKGADEIDDGFAVLMALDNANLKTLGITLVQGNNSVENEYAATNRLLKFLPYHKRPPVKKGGILPLEIEQTYWPNSKNHELVLPNGCVNSAVSFMANSLKINDQITLVGLGPLTDIACLIKNYPQLHHKIKMIVALMGRYPNESMHIGDKIMIDFNHALDPEATKIVLSQRSIPVTLIPFQVNSSIFIPRDKISTSNKGNSLKNYLYQSTQNWISQWNAIFKQDGFYPWDTHVIFYIAQPNEYVCQNMGFEIVSCMKNNSRCVDHKKISPESLLYKESSQLFLSPTYKNTPQLNVCTKLTDKGKKELTDKVLSYF